MGCTNGQTPGFGVNDTAAGTTPKATFCISWKDSLPLSPLANKLFLGIGGAPHSFFQNLPAGREIKMPRFTQDAGRILHFEGAPVQLVKLVLLDRATTRIQSR
jgi:hypothetical protein